MVADRSELAELKVEVDEVREPLRNDGRAQLGERDRIAAPRGRDQLLADREIERAGAFPEAEEVPRMVG